MPSWIADIVATEGGRIPFDRFMELALYNPDSHRSLVEQAGTHPQNNSQSLLGVVLFCLGFPQQALARSSAAIAEARRLAHPVSLASSLSNGLFVLSLAGDNAALDARR